MTVPVRFRSFVGMGFVPLVAALAACSGSGGASGDTGPSTTDTLPMTGPSHSALPSSGPEGGAGSGGVGAGASLAGAPGGVGGGAAAAAGGGGGGASATLAPVYLKASNTGSPDLFGVAVALSADGTTLAVGANREASAATGVDGDKSDDSLADAGAVYVFSRSGDSWLEEAYLKASNSGMGDAFGSSVALSADGNTLVVGAPFEASSATGIDGEQNDDSLADAGAAYVFFRDAGSWQQQAYVKASNTGDDDLFGGAVALSADGNVLAIGAEGEDSSGIGIDADQTDKSLRDAGAVYLFERTDGAWQQTVYVKASNTNRADHFGGAVSLSSDGTVLAVGAYFEDSKSTGVNGDQSDNSAESAGAVYLFEHNPAAWQQTTYLKPAENDGNGYDGFGSSLSLSADGKTLAVGAAGDDSSASGIDGNPNDSTMPYAGAAYVFFEDAAGWKQRAYIKASNPTAGDEFGNRVNLSADGQSLAVGAALQPSAATGINPDASDASAAEAGAVYLFRGDATAWSQVAWVKAPNTDPGDRFGWSVGWSGDGDVLAVGASREASAATGVDGDEDDNSAAQSGAVFVYSGVSTWASP